MTVTQWFSDFTKPARKGWYECRTSYRTSYRLYWDGAYWLTTKGSKWAGAFGHYAGDKWRGLAVKP